MVFVMRDEIEWKGCKYSLELFDDKNFNELNGIIQVYGFVFDKTGKILIIKIKGNVWCLPGGTPEKYDSDWKDTLTREVNEEANVEIENIQPVGYIVSKSLSPGVQAREGIALRAVAKIKAINKRSPDPAKGSINQRKFIEPKDFLKYCPWGKDGQAQLDLALKVFNKVR